MTTIRRTGPRPLPQRTRNGIKRVALKARETLPAKDGEKPLRTRISPDVWIMAIVQSDRGTLDQHARETIAAAAILADAKTGVLAVVLGSLDDELSYTGADRIAIFKNLDFAYFDPDTSLQVIEDAIATYAPRHIIMPDDARGTGDLGRRLIAKTGMTGACGLTGIDHAHVAIDWRHGCLAQAPLPKIILLKQGTVDADLPFRGKGERVPAPALPAAALSSRYRDLGIETPAASAIALEDAELVVSAGRGVANTATLQTLADQLGAAVGASRVAVDEGRYPRDRQVGATGKTVSARGYVAVGISGAVQHLQGIANCRHVIAINKDAGAPIVKRADLTITGDAEEIMQAFLTRLAQARAQRETPESS